MAAAAKVMAGMAEVMPGVAVRSASTAAPNLCQHHVRLQPARQNLTAHLLMQLSTNYVW